MLKIRHFSIDYIRSEHTITGMDCRTRIPNIRALQVALGLSSYASLHMVLSGKKRPSVDLAKRIEASTGGAIRWTEFFEDPPAVKSAA